VGCILLVAPWFGPGRTVAPRRPIPAHDGLEATLRMGRCVAIESGLLALFQGMEIWGIVGDYLKGMEPMSGVEPLTY
jgi:hypothetical protein